LFAILEGKETFDGCFHPFCDQIFDLKPTDLEIYPEEASNLAIENLLDDIGRVDPKSWFIMFSAGNDGSKESRDKETTHREERETT
jgi:hypothetical protein